MNDAEKIALLREALGTCSISPGDAKQLRSSWYWFDEKLVKQALAATVPAQSEANEEQQGFQARDETRPAEQQGLFHKFDVRRTDGSSAPGGKHEHCRYFVIDMDHDDHAPASLLAYAKDCEKTHPLLSADLKDEVRELAETTFVQSTNTSMVLSRC